MDTTINPTWSTADRINAAIRDLGERDIVVTIEHARSGVFDVDIQRTPLSMADTNKAIEDALRSVGLLGTT